VVFRDPLYQPISQLTPMPFVVSADCKSTANAAFSVVWDHIGRKWEPRSLPNILLFMLSRLCKSTDKATYFLLRERAVVYNPLDKRFYSYYARDMMEHRKYLMYLMDLWMKAGDKKVFPSYPELRGEVDATAYTIIDSKEQTKGYLQVVRVKSYGLKVRFFNYKTVVGTYIKVDNGPNRVRYCATLDREIVFFPTHDTQGYYVAVNDGKNAIYRLSGADFASMFKALLQGAMYPLAQCQ
jgi:hypothetical protein